MSRQYSYEELAIRVADLEEQKRLLYLISNNIPASMAYIDPREWRYRFVNEQFGTYFNRSSAAILGQQVRELIGETSYAVALPYLEEARAGKTVSYEDVYNISQEDRWVKIHYVPDCNEQGQVVGVVVLCYDITEEKETARALWESEQRFKALHEASRSGIIIHDQGLILDCNRRLIDITGFSRDELIGMDGLKLIAPKWLEQVVFNIQRGYEQPYEVEGVRRDGSTYPLIIHGKNIPYKGRDVRVIEFRDITQRMQTENALREREERLVQVAEQSRTITWDINNKGLYTYVSHVAEQVWGYRADELVGKKYFYDLHPEHGRESFKQEAFALVADAKPFKEFLKPIQAKDGRVLWFSASGLPVYNDKGELLGYRGADIDVTDLKQTEDAILLSEKRFTDLVENSTDWIWEFDENEIFTFVSERVENLLGFTPAEVIGKSAFDLMPESEREKVRREFGPSKEAREPFSNLINVNQHKDGSLVTLESSGVPIIDSEGRYCGYRGIGRDITGRLNLEEQLRQSHKMEAIGTMAGGIAHDFNNILAAMIGYSELARDFIPESSLAREQLDQVLLAGGRAKDLIQHILMFSRMATHEERAQPLDLKPIVEEVLKFQRSTIPATVDLRSDIAENCGKINGDSTQVHQILMNLCTNAAHAMEEGGGTLTVGLKDVQLSARDLRAKPGLSAGYFVRLSVVDTGSGVSPAHLESIFDPYFTTKGVGKGSGMGLAVVHGIAQKHGGFVQVKSTLGEGSVFNVFFPRIEAETNHEDNVTEGILPSGNERILFIDDEVMLTSIGKATLERRGYSVAPFSDSMEALAHFQANPDRFDLVITDQAMPRVTGSELAKQMLAMRPDLPIILCTGYSTRIDELAAREIGIREYILKPVSHQVMATLIRRVLDGS